jgi:circadian clock protein KaiB
MSEPGEEATPWSTVGPDGTVPAWDPDSSVEEFVLRLYVSGMTVRSQAAVAAIKALCEELLAGHYDLEVVDLSRNPGAAKSEQIFASPTLVKQFPLPLRRLVGDLSRRDRVLSGLGLKPDA